MSAPAGPDLAMAPPDPMNNPVPMVPPNPVSFELDIGNGDCTDGYHLKMSGFELPLQLWLLNAMFLLIIPGVITCTLRSCG
jgi:hypothetical protein